MKVLSGVTLVMPAGPPNRALGIALDGKPEWITDHDELRERIQAGQALVITPLGGFQLGRMLDDGILR